MQTLLRFPLVVAVFLVCGIGSVADACYCGAARYRCCRQACCCTPCCSQPCCTVTVMRTCQEVVYDEVEQTCYKTVYEEVVENVPVDAVRYVEGTAYRCAPCTVMQPCSPQACGPAKTCAPAASQPAPCCDMVPVQVLRKVSYPTATPQHYQKMEERKRVVAKQVPYKITVCVPKVVYRQVPVTICCPLPSCCAMPSDCNK